MSRISALSRKTSFIVSSASPANAGTYTPDSSLCEIDRVSTTVAGFILAAPSGSSDGAAYNLEVTPTNAFTLTIASAILLTTGMSSTISAAAGKKLFVSLRSVSGTWFALAAGVQL